MGIQLRPTYANNVLPPFRILSNYCGETALASTFSITNRFNKSAKSLYNAISSC